MAIYIAASGAIIDFIAVADVEAELSAVSPERVLDESWKDLWEGRIVLSGVNPRGNGGEDSGAPGGAVGYESSAPA